VSDDKKDFRNIKQTQLDMGQVVRGSFSEQSSALRTVGVSGVLKDTYTHFIQEFNTSEHLTKVTYYQSTDPAVDVITFTSDASLDDGNRRYIVVQEFLTKVTRTFYIRLNGLGAAPGISDIETAIDLNTGDSAPVICYAFKQAMDNIDGFAVTSKSVLATSLEVEYLQFGETEAVTIFGLGISAARSKEGDSCVVGEIELSYDDDGNVVYNGSTLKGLVYNPFSASFDVNTVLTSPANGESTPVQIQNSEVQEAMMCVFSEILSELKKMNIYNSIGYEEVIVDEDIE